MKSVVLTSSGSCSCLEVEISFSVNLYIYFMNRCLDEWPEDAIRVLLIQNHDLKGQQCVFDSQQWYIRSQLEAEVSLVFLTHLLAINGI